MIAKCFEYLRFIIVASGAFVCHYFYNDQPSLFLHYMMPCIVLSLSGLTGIEGFFFSKHTAISLGRETGSPYQKQSAMNNLAVGATGLIVYLANWGVYADASMMICTLIFITLSAFVHTWEAVKLGNKNRKNKARIIWVIALLALCVPILFNALR